MSNRILLFVIALTSATAGALFAVRLADDARATPQEAAATAPAQTPAVATRGGQPLPDLTAVAERALLASVNISSTRYVRLDPIEQFFYGPNAVMPQQSLGSGVVVSTDGFVLTNAHVIGNARAEIRVTLHDGREVPGKIVGVDGITDLGVIKIEEPSLSTLPWGDSSQLRVAEWVVAVGNPFQLSGTVTVGVVSTVNRSGAQVGSVADFIQTDAAINPGNSGGALVNTRGELVGINTRIYTETGGYQGIGFAIPSNLARRIMDELKANGEVRWGSVGTVVWQTMSPALARRYGLSSERGVVVYRLDRQSVAARAGLDLGDVVTAINGEAVTEAAQLDRIIIQLPVGSTGRFTVDRGGKTLTVEVPIVARRR